MARRVTYATELAIIKYRMLHTRNETAKKFGVATITVTRVMERNPDAVAAVKKKMLGAI